MLIRIVDHRDGICTLCQSCDRSIRIINNPYCINTMSVQKYPHLSCSYKRFWNIANLPPLLHQHSPPFYLMSNFWLDDCCSYWGELLQHGGKSRMNPPLLRKWWQRRRVEWRICQCSTLFWIHCKSVVQIICSVSFWDVEGVLRRGYLHQAPCIIQSELYSVAASEQQITK